jgi:hypothetical protein
MFVFAVPGRAEGRNAMEHGSSLRGKPARR